jgi:hypothetical protein
MSPQHILNTPENQEKLHQLGVPMEDSPSLFAQLPNRLIMDIVKLELDRKKTVLDKKKLEEDTRQYHIDRLIGRLTPWDGDEMDAIEFLNDEREDDHCDCREDLVYFTRAVAVQKEEMELYHCDPYEREEMERIARLHFGWTDEIPFATFHRKELWSPAVEHTAYEIVENGRTFM